MMGDYLENQLGRFIDYDLWNEAFRLLDYQISLKEKNKHYNTLAITCYERIAEEDRKKVLLHDYYNNRIANGFFYGLQNEFGVYDYLLPKIGLNLRNYKFLSYSMRLVYYSVGLYLLRITEDFIKKYREDHPNIYSFYGGSLQFQNKSLLLKSEKIYYKRSYKTFRAEVKKSLRGNISNRVVMKLDIKDFYDELPVYKLLDLIDGNIKPGVGRDNEFDTNTMEQITFLFYYLTSNKPGIPQTENDIIAGFIGYLFLVFGDIYIENEIRRVYNYIDKHSIVRYVDDIYIIIDFKGEIGTNDREIFIDSLAARISDILYYKLGVKLNTKSTLYWLYDYDDIERLTKSLKKVSISYHIPDIDDDDEPIIKVENIFNELDKLKSSRLGSYFIREDSLELEIFKEIFDRNVDILMDKKDNLERIEYIFSNFNYDYIKVCPVEIIVIMLKSKSVSLNFRKFILSKTYLPTDDVELILIFLLQTGFDDEELIDKLRGNHYMEKIIQSFYNNKMSFDNPGYYNIPYESLMPILNKPSIIEQIRLRSMAERGQTYSLALNHLLNEIHSICFELDDGSGKDIKNYNVNNVIEFLKRKNIFYEIVTSIRNLFDRRNRNPISHPGSDKTDSWGVSKKEYEDFYDKVRECLVCVLK